MTNKHSKGPWAVSWNTLNGGEAHGIYASGEMDLTDFRIATVNWYPTMNQEADEETGKGNARLIAAAPELLQALVNMVVYFGTVPGMNRSEPQELVIKEARRLILGLNSVPQ